MSRSPANQNTQRKEPRAASSNRKIPPLVWHLLSAGISVVLLMFVFYGLGTYRAIEKVFFDSQAYLNSNPYFNLPAEPSPVVIVDITDADYERIFNGKTRPLNPVILQNLIETISKGQPCLIGVDIDTHFPEYKEDFKIGSDWNVIWAREPEEIPEEASQKLVLRDVLGRDDSELKKKAGVPLLLDDPGDKVTRFYTRQVETLDEGKFPTFVWAIYNYVRDGNENCSEINLARRNLEATTAPRFINFSRGREGAGRKRIPASHVLQMANNDLLRGKIVILGGSYLGEDKHDTPLGMMSGVEILANAVETELKGGGAEPLSRFGLIVLLTFQGFLVISFFRLQEAENFVQGKTLFVLLIGLGALTAAMFCYLAINGNFSQLAYLVAVVLGVVFYETVDAIKDFLKKQTSDALKDASGKKPKNKKTTTKK